MLASCVSTTMSLYARARGWELGELRVDVAYDPDETPRRVELRVFLPDGLTADQIRRLRKVADTCPARRALEAGFAFDEQLVVGSREFART
jgi:putative redox protein